MNKGLSESGIQPENESSNEQNSDEDHDIIRLVLNESVNAYRLLIDKYQVPVYNLFIRMLHNREDAEELTQDVFVKVYEALPGFRFEYRFFSWLYRIALNTALSHMKRQRSFVGIEHLANLSAENNERDAYNDIHLKMAVEQLKVRSRAVIIMKYYQQLSYREVAFALDIPETKVRSRLYDARLQLKEILEKTGYF